MTSRFLRDLLYDKAIEGADAIRSLGERSEVWAADIRHVGWELYCTLRGVSQLVRVTPESKSDF